jgi:N-acetylglucosamine-6-sulfatase
MLLGFAWVSKAMWAAEPATRPNIVFIIVDDLRFNALSCMGHPFLKTPHIDRIAAEGALFQNAFVTTPLCSPSRASFLTGRYAHAHGVVGNGNRGEAISHKLVTFPLLLDETGYDTAYVGKWHMGDDDSPRPGFDRWVSFKGQGAYENPVFNVDGQQVHAEGYVTDLLTDYAVEFVRQARAKPFVLYLAHKAVHANFTPAPRHAAMFADQPIPRTSGAQDTLEGKPVLRRTLPRPEKAGEHPGLKDDIVRRQLAAVLAIDEGVGRLLEALEQSEQLDNTLIIFTSDNGFFWGEHGLGDKRAAYEESIRVPLLMRYPPLLPRNTTIDEIVLNVDIVPTLLELAGAAIPEDVHGRSVLSLLKGDTDDWRTSFLAEYFGPVHERVPRWQAVRTARWKYIHYPDFDGMDEIYDLAADQYEMTNLVKEPTAAAQIAELRTELDRLIAITK